MPVYKESSKLRMGLALKVAVNSTLLIQKVRFFLLFYFKYYISPVPGIFGFHTLHTEGQDCRSYNLYEELSTGVSYRETRVLEVAFFLS